ncbi:DUF1127 domain-containing protein [Ferruginivarius sediminum]|uniref:DUF1127 domain-containing protein n=1 Tax=Ferruginivarius sediminum TaxID=2661937 RepID=A0A369T661_9PROT|nr:DUF1127 domain-containing protein [Ferruginivarius sediminum]RDD60811.1 hypothetical protein DRB17_15880 [Ferruginivarius sediminum]
MTAATIASTIQTLPWNRQARRLARIWADAQRRRRIARTVRALKALDNRTLAWMGVPRESIHEYATQLEDGEV